VKLNSCCQVKSDTQCENNVFLEMGKNISIIESILMWSSKSNIQDEDNIHKIIRNNTRMYYTYIKTVFS
jgi:hypothetical protein